VVRDTLARLPLLPAKSVSGALDSGLTAAYYEGLFLSPAAMVANAAPKKKFRIRSLNISGATLPEEFGYVFTGFIKVPTTGLYSFYDISDDSSELYIDSMQVVATNYNLGERSGDIGLSSGFHEFKMVYHQGSGGKKLIVEYEGPGISRQVIDSSIFFRTHVPLELESPHGALRYGTGESMTIMFSADTSVKRVVVDASCDSGVTWHEVSRSGGIVPTDVDWGKYVWTIPDSIGTQRVVGSPLMVRVRDANNSGVVDKSIRAISVFDPSPVLRRKKNSHAQSQVIKTPAGIAVRILESGDWQVRLFAVNGRLVAAYTGTDKGLFTLGNVGMTKTGIFVVELTQQGTTRQWPVVLTK
jgi:hypothetical protein